MAPQSFLKTAVVLSSMISTSVEGVKMKPQNQKETGTSTKTFTETFDFLTKCLEQDRLNQDSLEQELEFISGRDYGTWLQCQQRQISDPRHRLGANGNRWVYNRRFCYNRLDAINACVKRQDLVANTKIKRLIREGYEKLKQEVGQIKQKNRAFCDEMIAVLEREDGNKQDEENVQALEKKNLEYTLKLTDKKCLQLLQEQDSESKTKPGPNNPKKPYWWRAKTRQLLVLNKLVANNHIDLGLHFQENQDFKKDLAFKSNWIPALQQKIEQLEEEELKRQSNVSSLLGLKLSNTGLPEHENNFLDGSEVNAWQV